MNEQSGKEISLSNYQIDIMEEFFDDVRLLASFIGCPIFEKQEKTKMKNGENLFHIKCATAMLMASSTRPITQCVF